MIVQHEQQHDETMLATHQLRSGPAVLHAPPPPEPSRPVGGGGAGAGRRVHHGHRHRPVGAGQRAPGAPGRPAGVRHRRRAGDQRRSTRPSSPTAATREPRWWSPAGWAHRRPGGSSSAPMHWRRDGDDWSLPALRPVGPRSRRRAGGARLLVRGAGVRGVGRQAAADRGGVGEGGPVGPGDRAVPPLPLGGRRPDRRRTPTSASGTCGRRRWARTRPAPRRWACTSSSATSGSGRRPRSDGHPGLHRVPLPGILGGLLRRRTTGCCAAARSAPTGPPAGAPSATGTIRSAGRSSAASAAPATPDRTSRTGERRGPVAGRAGALMCRHLAYLGPPVTAGRAAVRPAALAGAAVLGAPRHARRRHDQRRRVRRRLVPGRAASRCATGGRSRCGATRPSPQLAAVTRVRRGAGGGALGHRRDAGARRRGGAVRRGALAVQPQRCGPRLAGLRGRRSPPACRCVTCSPWTPPPTRRCSGRWCGTGCAPASTAAEAVGRDGGRRSPPPRPGRGSTCCSPTGDRAVASVAGHALSVRAGAGSVLVASEPLDDDPGWRPVPDGHLVVATAGEVRVVHCRPGCASPGRHATVDRTEERTDDRGTAGDLPRRAATWTAACATTSGPG